ncbi:hypothetical protein BpHYR1_009080 [Brachionus plicatilis]|uniref:Uncharacterized protein n=1 Tax=Brachionus plicatilis TaxID=10195 RepID=A0A3M7QNM1_BRAPC|nr:hypothetical protein BpHYR1_009080 [Brachionus plicatilis]
MLGIYLPMPDKNIALGSNRGLKTRKSLTTKPLVIIKFTLNILLNMFIIENFKSLIAAKNGGLNPTQQTTFIRLLFI